MINQIKKKIEGIDIKWRIGGLIGLAAVAGLLYIQFSKSHETPKTGSKKPALKEVEQETPEKALIRVINKIKKSFGEGGRMEFETIKNIYLGHYDLSRREYIEMTTKHRAQRRKVVDNLEQYHKLCLKYESDIEELHSNHLNAILAHFRIEKEGWISIIDQVSADNKDEWEELLKETDNQEMASLRNKDKPKIKRDVLIKIYQFKAAIIDNEGKKYKDIPNIDQADLYSLVDKQLQDKVLKQFNVEEEDIKYSENELNEKDAEAVEREEELVLQKLRILIFGQDEDEEGSQERPRRDQDSQELEKSEQS